MALDNCIGLFVTGSHLYGTSTPASDHDYEGIFIGTPEYEIGMKSCDEVNFSTGNHNEKNTKDDIDCKLYSLKKYFSLAQNNNPNKVEYFFVPDDLFVYRNDKYWKQIVDNKDLFLSLKIKHSFGGYAHAQKKKLLTKKKRLDELRSFNEVLEQAMLQGAGTVGQMVEKLDMVEVHTKKKYHPETNTIGEHKVKKLKTKYDCINYKKTEVEAIVIDNKEYNFGMSLKKVYDYVKEEIAKYGQRTKYIEEHGFDLKFAAHLFRLYYEGLRLLTDGELIFPMPDLEKKVMMDIKNGNHELDFILESADRLEPIMDRAYDINKSGLRHSPDQQGIHELLVKMTLQYWKEKGMLKLAKGERAKFRAILGRWWF